MGKGRILGIDYGKTRIGVSTTDPDQIIATGLKTIDAMVFREFLEEYIQNEKVVKVVFGKPVHQDGRPTSIWPDIKEEADFIVKTYPSIAVDFQDESFTSQDARSIIFQLGAKKSKRRDKKTVDKIAAILILQKYLGHI
jgi:putative Holliday junction resolvase